MEKFLSAEQLNHFEASFRASRANFVAMNAVTVNGVNKSAQRWIARSDGRNAFSIQLDNRGISNQKSSGRCWMFAALNCLRYKVMHDLDLAEFEFSQNYTFFYDKLERANYFLECILSTIELDTDSREVTHLLDKPAQDGGQWDMISNVIMKYGLVPKDAMPEDACSSNSRDMNAILSERLREDACILRQGYRNGKAVDELREDKAAMLETFYRMLCICLGTPPKTVDFEVRTRSGNFIQDCGITPQEFYQKYVKLDLNQYVSLINAPTADKPFYRSYTVQYLGNVLEGRDIRYVNLPIQALKDAAIAQMRDGEPVWFGCDVGKRSMRPEGVMDVNAYDYDALFDTTFQTTKAERLEYNHSRMTHAMVFQGVDLDETGSPVRWRVENSWGDESGFKGMYLMTDAWFDEYMYQVVVNKRYLSDDAIAAYDSEPTVLAPWDPMGALAQG
ncbi:MAG: C1 family peptidase [Clostridiales bacterium]|nr:C1 family peptidase [Clostridiales bacterium]